eukprot:CAMPEP_0170556200 /NCGR_PEP_ID=MMETSP0211-20121228/15761_1 /TAXON_ID=311385 /ORGANISM="Pseudokeronopsis sp., Strain OXSARD2" /LENGTH=129 /DNA_ID=CAMNT_0010866383 /DNA_START=334 /DNA_END=723 /DNA_ORIENTATION=+
MLLEVGALRKTLGTSWYSACEGLLLSVYPEVIEEVAPLPELLPTALVAAFHDSSNPLSVGVLVFEDLIVRSIRNMLGLADPMEGLHLLLPIFFGDDLTLPAEGLVVLLLIFLMEEMSWHFVKGLCFHEG